MPRHRLRRLIPAAQAFSQHRALRPFGPLIHDANLWHLNRYSVSTAVFVGIFFAFIPLPLQSLMAAGVAIVVRCNLPLAVLLIWISNPVTMPPMFYATYKLGAWLMGIPPQPFHFEFTREWFALQIIDAWQPLLLGSVVAGLLFGLLGFIAIRLLWRQAVVRRWQARKLRRKQRPADYS